MRSDDDSIEFLRGRGVPLTEVDKDQFPITSPSSAVDVTATNPAKELKEGEVIGDSSLPTSVRDAPQPRRNSILSSSGRILQEMQEVAKVDRAVLEAGSTAFMSFLRAYKEHQVIYIVMT